MVGGWTSLTRWSMLHSLLLYVTLVMMALLFLETISRRIRDVDMKRDYAFVEFSDARDADDARYSLDGRDVDGRRITVEFAKGVPRGAGGAREYAGRGPPPGSGRCFNCGLDGHWARDCKAGDWKNKCYRCQERGHIERNCQNSPKKASGRRSYSRSPVRSRSPRRAHRSRSRSISRSRSYSRSRSPAARRGRETDHKERRSRSPRDESPEPKRSVSPSKTRKSSLTPDRDGSIEKSPSPARVGMETERVGYNSDSPKETSRSPSARRYDESPANGRSPSPKDDRSPVDDDDDTTARSPRGSESP
ncbi:hypothetical protein CASFOL_027631 [Castilleja foliolosa]|uniref:Uncharacterized protein n=1 Tax=Castilleja foliolosa TaxID=1961234 RepID=A0ABD3CIK5_9LAMI